MQAALLIFDEIISFRSITAVVQQELYNVRPDFQTCLAKVIAGGTPGAAFGGRDRCYGTLRPHIGRTEDSTVRDVQRNVRLHMVAGLASTSNDDTRSLCKR